LLLIGHIDRIYITYTISGLLFTNNLKLAEYIAI